MENKKKMKMKKGSKVSSPSFILFFYLLLLLLVCQLHIPFELFQSRSDLQIKVEAEGISRNQLFFPQKFVNAFDL